MLVFYSLVSPPSLCIVVFTVVFWLVFLRSSYFLNSQGFPVLYTSTHCHSIVTDDELTISQSKSSQISQSLLHLVLSHVTCPKCFHSTLHSVNPLLTRAWLQALHGHLSRKTHHKGFIFTNVGKIPISPMRQQVIIRHRAYY